MSANPDLISLLENTTDGAHCEGLAQVTHFVQERLTHRPATQLHCNGETPLQLYCQYVETLPTPPVKGNACAMAERAQAAALNSPDPNEDGTMLLAFRMAAVDNAANDCPKKHDPADVLRIGRSLLKGADVRCDDDRATEQVAAASLRAHLPNVKRSKPWEALEIEPDPGAEILGRVWLDIPHLHLGRQARLLIRAHMLRHSASKRITSRIFERTTMRSPASEVAALLSHRLRSLGRDGEDWLNAETKTQAIASALQTSCRTPLHKVNALDQSGLL